MRVHEGSPYDVLGDLMAHALHRFVDGAGSMLVSTSAIPAAARYAVDLGLYGGDRAHIHDRVGWVTGPGRKRWYAAHFACGGQALHVELVVKPEEWDICAKCEKALTAVVYFAEKDGLIKIGTSANVDNRMKSLSATLLATEPGYFAEERKAHARFAASRVHGEWFAPTDDLLEHIEMLRGAA